MDDAAFIVELLAGIFFTIAAVPLLRLAARTRQYPERMLGITFLLFGISYLFYEAPYLIQREELFAPLSFGGRLLWNASVLTTALFTREVFHRERRWSRPLLWGITALLLVGIAISIQQGDLEGMAPNGNPGFWLEWIGQVIPFLWVVSAALTEYASARRRVRIGLANPLVCNRYLLFACFGFAQLATIALLVPMFDSVETNDGAIPHLLDQLMGAFEMLTLAIIWLAFFPPRCYREWIALAAARSAAAR
ncbi:MAG TPA: hypothetical protein VEC18_09365 [Myxococcota bacterium]|nr:hypothetical protein [Myxococcota bacterium]